MALHLIPSRRGRPGNDPIFNLSRLAAERAAAGGDVINGTLGVLLDDDGALVMLPALARALQEVAPAVWASYAPIAGAPAFLEAVKADILGEYPALRARAVSCATPGGSGALRQAITTFLEEGDALLTTSWYWSPYETIALENGRRVETFSMLNADGAFDAEAMAAALAASHARQGRALLLLNDPCHNPTGYSMSERDWEATARVVAAAAERGPVVVVLDMAYAAFRDGALAMPLRAIASLADRALVAFCWSASKTFLAYGQRVGALVVVPPDSAQGPEISAALSFACRGTWSNCNHGGMAAITRLLTDPVLREAANADRRVAVELLDGRIAIWNQVAPSVGLAYPRYAGGFFVAVECPKPDETAAMLREQGIFVVPIAGALRVALCSVRTHDVDRLARAMAAAVAATSQR